MAVEVSWPDMTARHYVPSNRSFPPERRRRRWKEEEVVMEERKEREVEGSGGRG